MFSTHRNGILFLLGFLIAAGPALAESNQPDKTMLAMRQLEREDQSERLRLADAIMAERESLSGRTFDVGWKMNMVRNLAGRSQGELHTLLDDAEAGVATGLSKELGDSGADLVFTPLDKPCRFYDSRNDDVPGPFFAGEQFNFYVAGFLPSSQGASTNCGIPFGPATAIVANVLAVDTGGKGNWQVWPFGGTAGDAVINFAANSDLDINLINGVMIPICNPAVSACGAADLTAKLNFAAFSHFVINVTGYFAAPVATPLSCQTISDSRSVAVDNFWSFTSGSCPAGFTMTGGGFNFTGVDEDVWWWQSGPEGNAFRCRGENDSLFSVNVTCYARCCQVPGR